MAEKTNKYSPIFLAIIISVAVFAQLSFCRICRAKEHNGQSTTPLDVSKVDADPSPYLIYLKQHAKSPIEYVVDKFEKHDVVILGEMHEVRENCELISSLIDPLYHKAGVRCLATEFLKHKNIVSANKLITAQEYDQNLAIQLYRDLAQPMWGFKEYMDILKAIWTVNSKLDPQDQKFKIIGLDSDWEAYDLFCGSENSQIEVKKIIEERDSYMANAVISEVIKKSEKAIVHTGYNHSFTKYQLPKVINNKLKGTLPPRLGRILYKQYGDQIFQICLHTNHFGTEVVTGGKPTSKPMFTDFIEDLLRKNRNKPVGFDIENSPFANLRDRKSYYFAFQKEVVFSDIAQGYVFLKPLAKLSKITWINGFIDESNFEKVKAIALKRRWIKPGECNTPEQLDRKFKLIFESSQK